MSVLFRRLLWAVVCLAAVTSPRRAESHKPIRLAVVDVGSAARVPANFMDSLVVSTLKDRKSVDG